MGRPFFSYQALSPSPVVFVIMHGRRPFAEARMPDLTPVLESEVIEETLDVDADGQTVFQLSYERLPGGIFIFAVNGVGYKEAVDFQVVGKTVEWISGLFPIETTDRVTATYERF
jgi:hypothetical protein